MQEEITATVQLIYSCPAEPSLPAQSDMIHDDLVRLLDADNATGVALVGLTIQHLQSEAMTYGHVEPREGLYSQRDRVADLLEAAYLDAQCVGEALSFALCDLRHLADQHELAFGLWDKSGHAIYRAERQDHQVSEGKVKP